MRSRWFGVLGLAVLAVATVFVTLAVTQSKAKNAVVKSQARNLPTVGFRNATPADLARSSKAALGGRNGTVDSTNGLGQRFTYEYDPGRRLIHFTGSRVAYNRLPDYFLLWKVYVRPDGGEPIWSKWLDDATQELGIDVKDEYVIDQTVQIPKLKPGKYVFRIITMHAPRHLMAENRPCTLFGYFGHTSEVAGPGRMDSLVSRASGEPHAARQSLSAGMSTMLSACKTGAYRGARTREPGNRFGLDVPEELG